MDLYAYMYHTLGDVFVSVDVRSGPDRKNVFFQSPKVTPVAQSRVGSFILPEPIVHVLHIADGIYLFFRRKNGRRSATRPVAGRRAGSVNSAEPCTISLLRYATWSSVLTKKKIHHFCFLLLVCVLLLVRFGLRLYDGQQRNSDFVVPRYRVSTSIKRFVSCNLLWLR